MTVIERRESIELGGVDPDFSGENYQLLGRGVTLNLAAIGELVELVGVVTTNWGVFAGDSDTTLSGLITAGLGIGTIFVIENMVMKRGYDAGISLDMDLVKKISIRAIGGMALIAGYFTIIAGFIKDNDSMMYAGTATLDAGVCVGLVGLYLLRDYL